MFCIKVGIGNLTATAHLSFMLWYATGFVYIMKYILNLEICFFVLFMSSYFPFFFLVSLFHIFG